MFKKLFNTTKAKTSFIKNSFEEMCDDMKKENENSNEACNDNPIICAKRLVEAYVQGDINKLLKLKAESSGITYHAFVSTLFSMLSVVISFCAVILSIFDGCIIIAVPLVCIVLICGAIIRKIMKVFSAVNRYGDYIIVAINELEKEYN